MTIVKELNRVMQAMGELKEADVKLVADALDRIDGDICRKAIAATLLMFVEGRRDDAQQLATTLASLVQATEVAVEKEIAAKIDVRVSKDWKAIERISARLDGALPSASVAALAVAFAIDCFDGDVAAAESHIDALVEASILERDGGSN